MDKFKSRFDRKHGVLGNESVNKIYLVKQQAAVSAKYVLSQPNPINVVSCKVSCEHVVRVCWRETMTDYVQLAVC